jgi:predicted nucleic acid-binding Zn ribbon protein
MREGTKDRESADSSHYEGPQLLGESLNELISQRGWSEKVRDSDLFAHWEKLVGRDIAERVQPVSFTSGTLTLSAESTAWATQLRLIDQQIITALGQGGFEVTELVIKGPTAPSWRKGGWSVKGGRGPRDTYG